MAAGTLRQIFIIGFWGKGLKGQKLIAKGKVPRKENVSNMVALQGQKHYVIMLLPLQGELGAFRSFTVIICENGKLTGKLRNGVFIEVD